MPVDMNTQHRGVPFSGFNSAFSNVRHKLSRLLFEGLPGIEAELAASLTLLYRRTRNRAVRAKHAAIACEGLKSLPAAFAVVKELAGVSRHGLNGLMTAVRASKR